MKLTGLLKKIGKLQDELIEVYGKLDHQKELNERLRQLNSKLIKQMEALKQERSDLIKDNIRLENVLKKNKEKEQSDRSKYSKYKEALKKEKENV